MQLHHYQLNVPANPADYAVGRQTLVVTAVDTEYTEICSAVVEYDRAVVPPGMRSVGMFQMPSAHHVVQLRSLKVHLPDHVPSEQAAEYNTIGYNCAMVALDALRHHIPGAVLFRIGSDPSETSYKVLEFDLLLKNGTIDPDFLDEELNKFDAEMVDPSMIVWNGPNRVDFHPVTRMDINAGWPVERRPISRRPEMTEVDRMAAHGKVTDAPPSWAVPSAGTVKRVENLRRFQTGSDLIAMTYRRLVDEATAQATNAAYQACMELDAMLEERKRLCAQADKLLAAEEVLGPDVGEAVQAEMIKRRGELADEARDLGGKIHDQCRRLEVKVRIAFEHPAPEPETPAPTPVEGPAVGDAAVVQTPPAE